jgi:hypothetical protein
MYPSEAYDQMFITVRPLRVFDMEGQALFTGLLCLYAATQRDLKNFLKQEPPMVKERDPAQSTEEFREQKRRKRTTTDEQVENRKKPRWHTHRDPPRYNPTARCKQKTSLPR